MELMRILYLLLLASCCSTQIETPDKNLTKKDHTTYTADILSMDLRHHDRLNRLLPITMKIVNSKYFKLEVMNYKFADTKDTNLEVYNRIMRSPEDFKDWDDYNWDLSYRFTIDTSNNCNLYGWTYQDSKTTWFNLCNFDKRNDASVVGTICHEQMHKLGYNHSTDTSYNSVPYAVGGICEGLFYNFE